MPTRKFRELLKTMPAVRQQKIAKQGSSPEAVDLERTDETMKAADAILAANIHLVEGWKRAFPR